MRPPEDNSGGLIIYPTVVILWAEISFFTPVPLQALYPHAQANTIT